MTRYPRCWLAALTVACLLPWINRAVAIDDPLFLQSAKAILDNPWDYYAGDYNWYGAPSPLSEIIKNPPLQSFYLALVASIAGFHEVPLHLAMLFPAVALVLGTYELARRFSDRPGQAGMIALGMPVLLVSSMSLMCDVPMVACWVWALALWIRGVDDRHTGWMFLACLLMTAAALFKYFGAMTVPLAFVYAAQRLRRPGWWTLLLLIPVTGCAAFEAEMRNRYGIGAFLEAASFATTHGNAQKMLFQRAGLVGMLYVGGALLPVLFLAPWLWNRWGKLIWVGIGAAVAAGAWYVGGVASTIGGSFPLRTDEDTHWLPILHVSLFLLVTLQLAALAVTDVIRHRDAKSVLLLLWVGGTFSFTAWVNWTINARVILPLAPAAAILIARRFDTRDAIAALTGPAYRDWSLMVPLTAALAVSLVLCWADTLSANADRIAAETIAEHYLRDDAKKTRVWFLGHWGIQYYLERDGAKAFNILENPIVAGEMLVIPEDNCNVIYIPQGSPALETIQPPLLGWCSTLSNPVQAAFYSSGFGVLPYYFGAIPSRSYRVYDVLQTFQQIQLPAP